MGNTWEVWSYVPNRDTGGYEYQQVWHGQSVFGCIHAAIKAKRGGAGCVKVEWRG